MFTSYARVHGGALHKPRYNGEETMEICKRYAELSYSPILHIYSKSVACYTKGELMIKALVLQYPEDPNVRYLDTKYLLCNDFLVDLVFEKEGISRIYLPKGQWMDYLFKEVYDGER